MHRMNAARAYQARSADRSLREQEADVFRRATAALRLAQAGNEFDRVRAVADNRMLWNTLVMTLKDPQNALPETLRSSIISVGMAVERELSEPQPDFPFVIGINEHITAGLIGA